jgi:hypothetical protein
LKRRDSGTDVVILLVNDTAANRNVLREHREALRTSFPSTGERSWQRSARGGDRPPAGSWCCRPAARAPERLAFAASVGRGGSRQFARRSIQLSAEPPAARQVALWPFHPFGPSATRRSSERWAFRAETG